MNEELQNQLAEVVRKSIELAEKTGEFAIDKAPELIHQFLMWELWSSIIVILFLSPSVFIFIKIKNWIKREENVEKVSELDEDSFFTTNMIGLAVLGIPFGIACAQLFDIAKILIAPEIYLIEYFL